MKKLTLACSPLTGTIFAGTILKPGVWGKEKQDVTDEAYSAVAQSLLHNKIFMEYNIEGKTYQLQMVESTPATKS